MLKNLYVIAGKSGTGKTTLAGRLSEQYGYRQAESYTDRAMRYEGERGHHFLSKEEFDRLEDKVLETVFDTCRYTMTTEMLNQSDIAVLDLPGIKELKETYKDRGICVIGVEADSRHIAQRMEKRGDGKDKVSQRLAHDDAAFDKLYEYCDVIVMNNGSIDGMVANAHDCISKVEAGTCAAS